MAVPCQMPEATVPKVEVPEMSNMDAVAVPAKTRLPDPYMLPTTVSASWGVVVPIPRLPDIVVVPVVLSVPLMSNIYEEVAVVPIRTLSTVSVAYIVVPATVQLVLVAAPPVDVAHSGLPAITVKT